MEWMALIGSSIQYMEAHIAEPLTVEEIARAVNVSPFYFQKGFAMLYGFGIYSQPQACPGGKRIGRHGCEGDRSGHEIRL